MSNPYGGTIPEAPTTTVPEATTTVPAKPAPAPAEHELAFTGYDVVGTLVLALGLIAAGWAAIRASRLKPHPADDLLVPGAGGDR